MNLELNDFEEKILYIAISDAINFEKGFQEEMIAENDKDNEIPILNSKERLSALYSFRRHFP